METVGKQWRAPPVPEEVNDGDMGDDGIDGRTPWDCWPKEAPEEGDYQAPGDYRATDELHPITAKPSGQRIRRREAPHG